MRRGQSQRVPGGVEMSYPMSVRDFLKTAVEPSERSVLLHLRTALEDLRDLAHKNPEEVSYNTAVQNLERVLRRLERVLPEVDTSS